MHAIAAYVPKLGPASLIEYGPLEIPGPGSRDVLIATHAVALNPVDTFVRSGHFPTEVQLPLILGRDVVGTVLSAPAESDFAIGQWVWANSLGYDGRQGSFADVAIAPANRAYPLPEGTDPNTAISLAHPASTAALAFAKVNLAPEDVVFIGGGGGNVGGAAVTFAALSGARVVTTASPTDAPRARKAGADTIINHHDPDAPERLREEIQGAAQICWDTSGKMDYSLLADCMAVGGDVLITAAGPNPVEVPWADLYTRDVTLRAFAHSRAGAKELAHAAQTVNRLLAQGALGENITEVLPLSQAARAHEKMENGEVRGRILLHP